MKTFKFVVSGFIIILIVLVSIFVNNKEDKEKYEEVDSSVSYDLFSEYYDEADKIISKMSLKEKVGQLFLVRFNEESVLDEIENYYPAGYIFFAKDFENETKSSFSEKIRSYQSKSKNPLVIAVDEEGGIVTRVSRFSNFRDEKFLSPRQIYDIGGYDLLEKNEEEKAKLLLSLGINLNLAPVADVSVNENDYIYDRSFGYDANKTSEYVKKMVEFANEWGISSSLKHFPGYGSNLDTHTGVAIDNRSYETFITSDLLPFESGISANVPTILFSHNVVNCIDSQYPASLSLKMHKLLRDDLGFSGVIITDDLAMGAVKDYADSSSAATLAVNALNDLIITSDFKNMYNEVLTNIENEKIKKSTVNQAVKRVIAWKYAYGLY